LARAEVQGDGSRRWLAGEDDGERNAVAGGERRRGSTKLTTGGGTGGQGEDERLSGGAGLELGGGAGLDGGGGIVDGDGAQMVPAVGNFEGVDDGLGDPGAAVAGQFGRAHGIEQAAVEEEANFGGRGSTRLTAGGG